LGNKDYKEWSKLKVRNLASRVIFTTGSFERGVRWGEVVIDLTPLKRSVRVPGSSLFMERSCLCPKDMPENVNLSSMKQEMRCSFLYSFAL